MFRHQRLKIWSFFKLIVSISCLTFLIWFALIGLHGPHRMKIVLTNYVTSFCFPNCRSKHTQSYGFMCYNVQSAGLDNSGVVSNRDQILPKRVGPFKNVHQVFSERTETEGVENGNKKHDGGYVGGLLNKTREEPGWGNSSLVEQRLPQCLIIGVRKGGTRALIQFLRLHPSIRSHKHEVHFFDDNLNYSKGLQWYRHQMPFSSPTQITIEKTPAYFVKDQVPERVYLMNTSIKLLLIVRNPIDRTLSDYTQIRGSKQERNKSYPSFESLVVDPATGKIRRNYRAIRRSIYHWHMSRWLAYFKKEQIHLVSGEQLVKDPLSELKKIEIFLNLSPKLRSSQFYLNSTRGFYCMRLESGDGRCLGSSKGRNHVNVEPQVIKKLVKFFWPHNDKFYRLVGKDFGWPR